MLDVLPGSVIVITKHDVTVCEGGGLGGSRSVISRFKRRYVFQFSQYQNYEDIYFVNLSFFFVKSGKSFEGCR